MENIKEWFRNLFTFCKAHFRLVLELAVIALILIACVFIYVNHKKTAEEIPVITTVYSASDDKLVQDAVLDAAKANNRQVSNNDANDIARLANRSESTEKAYAHSITTDEALADNQAQQIAKDRKADLIIKQTSTDKQASNDKINMQDNNYYIIQQERKHSVAVGIADVNNEASATVSYRNRKTEYTAYYSPERGKVGAGVSYQVASW